MTSNRRLWTSLSLLLIASFSVLLWMGREIYHAAPPVPERVVAANGALLFDRDDIETGRIVWQTTGGQQLGSIWGHGAYVAPDWSADWLHREAEALLEIWARRDHDSAYAALDAATRESLAARLRAEMRANTYDATTRTLTLSNDRALAIENVGAHYVSLFGNDPATAKLRRDYAMRDGTVDTLEHREKLGAFFFWTAWAAVTDRPGDTKTYTNNWPYDPLIGNTPTPRTTPSAATPDLRSSSVRNTRRPCSYASRPAVVGFNGFDCRSSNSTPSMSSRFCTRRVTPGWVRFSRADAAMMEPVSTTATKATRSLVFMTNTHIDYRYN